MGVKYPLKKIPPSSTAWPIAIKAFCNGFGGAANLIDIVANSVAKAINSAATTHNVIVKAANSVVTVDR